MAIQFKSQSDIGKSLTRSKMILYEFFEKWHYFSLELCCVQYRMVDRKLLSSIGEIAILGKR